MERRGRESNEGEIYASDGGRRVASQSFGNRGRLKFDESSVEKSLLSVPV